MIYMADHGENPKLGHRPAHFTWDMARIPLWFAMSDDFVKKHPQTVAALKENAVKPFTNDMMFDSLCGVFGLKEWPFYNPKTTFPLLHTTALSRSFAPCTEIFASTAIQTSKVDFDSQAMSATSKGCRHGFLPSTFLSHCRLSTTSPSFRLHKRQNQYSVTNSPE